MLTIYGDRISGNCLKVKWVADHLGLDYQWVDVDVVGGGAKLPTYRGDFPMGQVPGVAWSDGRRLAQSNAIILYLAEASALVPVDAFARAEMLQWMFWEQYSHEPAIAVRRFQRFYLGKPDSDIDPALMVKGRTALAMMAQRLHGRQWFAGDDVSCADVALVAYTRVAHEGGFDLAEWPAIAAWVQRVEAALAIG